MGNIFKKIFGFASENHSHEEFDTISKRLDNIEKSINDMSKPTTNSECSCKNELDNLNAKIQNSFVSNDNLASIIALLNKQIEILNNKVNELETSIDNLNERIDSFNILDEPNIPEEPNPTIENTINNMPELKGCSVNGNNQINITGIDGEYTLVYIDNNGNVLSNYEEITK